MLNSTNATLQWHFHCVLSFLAVYPRNAQKTWHWRDICWMLLVNVTFTSERFLAPQRYFSIANLVCIYSRHSKKCLEFLAISLSQSHLCSQQLSKKSLHISWSPIEAAEELEVAKSVEMSEEAVRKSIFVESLEHCVVPTSDVDHALVGEDLDLEGSKMMNKNCDVDIEGSKKWHDGGKRMNEVRDEAEKAAVHSTKKGSLDKLTSQDGPIKITSVKLRHCWWFEKKKDSRGFWR